MAYHENMTSVSTPRWTEKVPWPTFTFNVHLILMKFGKPVIHVHADLWQCLEYSFCDKTHENFGQVCIEKGLSKSFQGYHLAAPQGPGRGRNCLSIFHSRIPNWLESMLEASYGCFLKWWYPHFTPQVMIILVGKPMVVGFSHHFRVHPHMFLFFRCRDTFLTQTFWISHRCHQAIWTQTFYQLHQRKFLNSQGFCNGLSDLQHTRILSLGKKSGKTMGKQMKAKKVHCICDIVCE